MSVTVTTHLFCDSCQNWDEDIFVSGVTTAEHREVRRIARRYGWIRKKTENGYIDICPECKSGSVEEEY
jgi:hypothetical protein